MLSTFNCGVGFCLIVKKENVNKIKVFFPNKYRPYEIGYITQNTKKTFLSKNLKW